MIGARIVTSFRTRFFPGAALTELGKQMAWFGGRSAQQTINVVFKRVHLSSFGDRDGIIGGLKKAGCIKSMGRGWKIVVKDQELDQTARDTFLLDWPNFYEAEKVLDTLDQIVAEAYGIGSFEIPPEISPDVIEEEEPFKSGGISSSMIVSHPWSLPSLTTGVRTDKLDRSLERLKRKGLYTG